jgi:large subunit ribosomal protein L28
MGRHCMITAKRTTTGNNVSHSNRRTRRRFLVNLRWKRFWFPEENRFIRIRVSSAGMRLIDKVGLLAAIARLHITEIVETSSHG